MPGRLVYSGESEFSKFMMEFFYPVFLKEPYGRDVE
jgi:hypothetical protein